MFATGLDDPRFWELRAEAARMLAQEMNDETAKATMQQIASAYDSLTAHVVLNAKAAHGPFSEQPPVYQSPNVTALQKTR